MEKNLLSLEASEFLQSKRMEVGVHLLQRLQRGLAKGYSIEDAVQEAKRFISIAIEEPLNIGSGHGPTNHFAYKVNRTRV